MSVLHVRQIESMLRERYADDDWTDSLDESQNLSRLLAHYAIDLGLGTDADLGACHVEITDGEGDRGIDAIGVDADNGLVVVAQSKWRNDGSGSVDQAAVLKFVAGVRGILDFEMAGPATWSAETQDAVRSAMASVGGRVRLVLASTANDQLAPEVREPIDDLLSVINDNEVKDPIATCAVLMQRELFDSVAEPHRESIALRMQLLDWGKQDDPHLSYYGRVSALDLAQMYDEHGAGLFAENIRMFLSNSDINDGIRVTVESDPERLWYYNNGVTILASSVDKILAGSSAREAGTFDLSDATIVNGAQTVTSLGKALGAGQEDQLSRAYVMVRCIQVTADDQDLGRRITRYANTQNVVTTQDFAFLDPEQHRLRKELHSLHYEYLLRAGEKATAADWSKVIPVREAAVALACASPELAHTVLAKREVSRLFVQDGGPYKALFNPTTSPVLLARSVEVLREVERVMEPISKEGPGHRAGVAVHGRHVIARELLQACGRTRLSDPDFDFSAWFGGIAALALTMHAALVAHFPDGYAGNLFKNRSRVEELILQVRNAGVAP